MNKRGLLIVVSGFSGSGKGTAMKTIVNKYDNYALSVSVTTRRPRLGERDGIDYFFKDNQQFETMIQNQGFIEYAKYVDHYYGTPKSFVEEQLDLGKDVILEIEIQGALQVVKMYPEAVLFFMVPPSAKELQKRLVGRGTEASSEIARRLQRAVEEFQYIQKYDYIIVNDDLERCVNKIHSIVQSEHSKVINNQIFIENMREELNGFSEGAGI